MTQHERPQAAAAAAAERPRLRRPQRHPALRRRDQPGRRQPADAPRRDPRRDRAERRRQDVAVQLADRRLHARRRATILLARPARRRAGQRARQEDPRGQPPRRRAHVPEHPAVPGADRAGEREGRRRDPAEVRPDRRRCSGLPWQRREERESTAQAYALLDRVGLAAPRQRAGRLAGLRRAAPAGDRPGAGHQPRRDPARRAGRRHQPGREARARRADQADQRATASACC